MVTCPKGIPGGKAAVRTRLKLQPGQPGTKKLVAEYGERLVCVRYRYDAERHKRLKTVELIVEEVDWRPGGKQPSSESVMAIRVEWGEVEVGRQVKQAGGKRDA